MKKISFLLLIFILLLNSCSQVLITGRKQLFLISDADLNTMSLQSYKQFIDSVPLSKDYINTNLVKKTGNNIANAVENYLKNNGLESELVNYQWEFNLVKNEAVNAFCMPGGKVVFFEGILPFTQTEAGLAVVMGHEIAHAVAKHSKERLSQQMLLSYGAAAADLFVGQKSDLTRAGLQTLYGLGAQIGVVLPYSRKHEYEADRLGLIFMAMAGYNPSEALVFWERMSANETTSVVEFMSTHPSNANRITNMKKVLVEAQSYYKPN
ncbi:MAG: M48 family metallopeptidase [Paludibacter sp.]|nr:M48 family metallopeptidase [Paludibacter sp.]